MDILLVVVPLLLVLLLECSVPVPESISIIFKIYGVESENVHFLANRVRLTRVRLGRGASTLFSFSISLSIFFFSLSFNIKFVLTSFVREEIVFKIFLGEIFSENLV